MSTEYSEFDERDEHDECRFEIGKLRLELAKAVDERDRLRAYLRRLTAREFAGHNGVCIVCRRTSWRGHEDGCELAEAREIVKP